MTKSVFSKDYRRFLRLLRAARERSGFTQTEVAIKMGETQSWVSKCERGERRIDVLELLDYCRAIKLSLPAFIRRLEKELKS